MNHADELWQEYAENGEILPGVGAPKSTFNDSAKISASVHIWIWRRSAMGGGIEMLVQKRSLNKRTWPGYWDISAAGHVNVDETLPEAAARESLEEINLRNFDESKLYSAFMVRVFPPFDDDHFCHVFLYRSNGNENFQFNDGEVEALSWVSLDKLRELIDNATDVAAQIAGGKSVKHIAAVGEKSVPHSDFYMAQLFAHLDRVSKLEAK